MDDLGRGRLDDGFDTDVRVETGAALAFPRSSRPATSRERTYGALARVVQAIAAGRVGDARVVLDHLIESLDKGSTRDLTGWIFATALSKRLASDRTAELNLYLRQFADPQIALFNLLATHLPTVALSVPLANALLARFVGGKREVTLLDIGIGSGRQEVALLHALAAESRLPEKLNVIAIEPDGASLARARDDLMAAAQLHDMQLVFHPVAAVVEDLGPEDWASFAAYGAPLVVNAAFAAHHIRCTDEGSARDDLFLRLAALGPDAVVLSEPSSNHHTSSFADRFENAWRHFSQTFEIIDDLGIGTREKAAMKMFFAREIEDILANAEESRCERHEPVHHWLARLRQAGFKLNTDWAFARGFQDPRVQVTGREGYLGLDYEGETLVAVVCATGARGFAN